MPRIGLFSSPLADVLGATMIGSNLMSAKRVADQQAIQPDEQSMRFANTALQTGEMQTSLPRQPGLFSSIATAWTGDPNVEARPKDVSAMQGALTARLKESEEAAGKIENWRNSLGWNDTRAMLQTPMGQKMMLDAFGTTNLDLSAPTTNEQKIQALNAYRGFQEKESQQRIDLAKKELETKIKMFQFLHPFQVGSPEDIAYKTLVASETTGAREHAAAHAQMTNWEDFDAHHLGWMIMDRKTVSPVTRGKGGYATPADAIADTVKNRVLNGTQAAQAMSAKARLDAIHELQNLVNTVFVDTRGMTPEQATAAIQLNRAKNAGKDWYDRATQKFDSIDELVYGYTHDIQHHWGNLAEINAIRKGSFPDYRFQGRQVAQQKLADLERKIRLSNDLALDKDEAEFVHSGAAAMYNNWQAGGSDAPETGAAEPDLSSSVVPAPSTPPPGLGTDSGSSGD